MESIAAVSTPSGSGGIAVIRLSGPDAFEIADKVWRGARLSDAASHTAHLGELTDENGLMLDQCVATVFHAGHSFTGENTVEFSIHGSPWLQREAVALLIRAGASAAAPGEFTRRAFLNGRIDLTRAEAIADMIAASSAAAVRIAGNQLKGTYSRRLGELRADLVSLASLLELELDFSEEEVEFADRRKLLDLTHKSLSEIRRLAGSFRAGRALKEGVAVAIAGVPNAGKSTLLNCLLQDEKAIVSDIPGTTRDIIEDTTEINGILYRFYDTAGLRETTDTIEQIGISRARDRFAKADIVIVLIDPTFPAATQLDELRKIRSVATPETQIIIAITKADLPADASESDIESDIKDSICAPATTINSSNQTDLKRQPKTSSQTNEKISTNENAIIRISGKTGQGIDRLITEMEKAIGDGADINAEIMVSNARHYDELTKAADSLERVSEALESNLPGDLIAQDLRQATHHLGQITGTITSETLLHTIFASFCIGK